MRFTASVLVLVLSVATLGALAAIWDPETNHYCGLAPHPKVAPALPGFPEGHKLIKSISFYRHGARYVLLSTLAATLVAKRVHMLACVIQTRSLHIRSLTKCACCYFLVYIVYVT